ncbi:MAG: hypothetical protein WBM77_06815 [Maribacter sp.]
MHTYHNILDKLNHFTKKYYTKMLIKGALLFLVLGLLFLLVVLGLEYFLWLNSNGRMVLFFCFILAGLILLYKFIFTPLLYLFKVKRGISNRAASQLIGKHFPEVEDKLYNLLDLADDKNQSELLLASIEQRSRTLSPVPFTRAVDFRENLKYAKYLSIPFALIGLVGLTGNLSSFFSSYDRVVNYDLAYEPPAPFKFELLSTTLEVLENESYTIYVTTSGEVRPDAVNIRINDKELLLQEENGNYKYTFIPPLEASEFQFFSGKVESKIYRLNVLKTPVIQNFELALEYPAYLNKKSESLKSTGNAIIPEGTKVSWKVVGKNTEEVQLIEKDTIWNFNKSDEEFSLSKSIYNNYDYQISTSNSNVKNYEKLDYRFTVIKDAYPTIKVEQILDSLNPNTSYFVGESSDDYKLTSIKLICYPESNQDEEQVVGISNPNSNFNQFYYTFPSGLRLDDSTVYHYYFVSKDNDAIHGGKSVKSQLFSSTLLNKSELQNKDLKTQQAIIGNMDKSLEKFKEQQETLDEINREQKEKEQLNYNDQNQIKDFLKKQQEQENLMQKFSKQLKENLDKTNEEDSLNRLLQERLERQELEAKKNEKLLEELNKIADKIDKEELTKRLDELSKKQQNSKRNLEQLLELTKRYYVTEKAAQLASDLNKLSKQQDDLSELKLGEDFSNKEQEELNTDFEKLSEELNELKKDNEDLKKPIDLKIDESKEEAIKQDQKEALEEINKHQGEEESSEPMTKEQNAVSAKQKQKSAAQKMKEMAKELETSSAGASGGSTITEDAEMLRQILDNLITFSFKQENLFEAIEAADLDITNFSTTVRKQNALRSLFEHVDDSLFALSLRRAELSEFVNEQITDVYYNIDRSLESIAENQMYQGVSYQKYVLNASNNLADFLADILDNMQQSMQSGSGSGSSQEGFQLPDIIKGQGELKEKMDGMGQSEVGKPKEGEGKGQQGEEGKDGEGEEGSKPGDGKNGKEGENGNSGSGNGKEKGTGQGQTSEEELKEIYEIYKEQQMLRQQLEQQLLDMINAGDRKLGEKLIRQMEDFENDLLENGVTQRAKNRINNIAYELLKLENAALKKGKKSERESNTNTNTFQNPILTKPSALDNYRNEIEILNRQALPLRQIFQNKVKEYFKSND